MFPWLDAFTATCHQNNIQYMNVYYVNTFTSTVIFFFYLQKNISQKLSMLGQKPGQF